MRERAHALPGLGIAKEGGALGEINFGPCQAQGLAAAPSGQRQEADGGEGGRPHALGLNIGPGVRLAGRRLGFAPREDPPPPLDLLVAASGRRQSTGG